MPEKLSSCSGRSWLIPKSRWQGALMDSHRLGQRHSRRFPCISSMCPVNLFCSPILSTPAKWHSACRLGRLRIPASRSRQHFAKEGSSVSNFFRSLSNGMETVWNIHNPILVLFLPNLRCRERPSTILRGRRKDLLWWWQVRPKKLLLGRHSPVTPQ